MRVSSLLLRHLMVTTATPAYSGCFCQKLVPIAHKGKNGCGATCQGSWERSKWAGTGGGRGHTCRPDPVEVSSYDTSRENQREGLEAGCSLVADRCLPDKGSHTWYKKYVVGEERVWTSKRWLKEIFRRRGEFLYSVREEAPPPPPAVVKTFPLFWAARNKRKRRRKQEEKKKVEKKKKKEEREAEMSRRH